MAEKYDSFDLEPQSVIESKMTEIIRAASQSGALGYKYRWLTVTADRLTTIRKCWSKTAVRRFG